MTTANFPYYTSLSLNLFGRKGSVEILQLLVQKNILSNNLSTRVLKEKSTEKSMKTAFQLVLLITRN